MPLELPNVTRPASSSELMPWASGEEVRQPSARAMRGASTRARAAAKSLFMARAPAPSLPSANTPHHVMIGGQCAFREWVRPVDLCIRSGGNMAAKKSASRKSAAKKAAKTRKSRAAGKKAAKTRKQPTAGKKAAATRKTRMATRTAAVPPDVADIDNRIAMLRNNLRELVEQAAAYSGASSEELISQRIAEQEAKLALLLKQREVLARRGS